MKKLIILLISFIYVYSQQSENDKLANDFVRRLDSLVYIHKLKENSLSSYDSAYWNIKNYPPGYVPDFPPEVYERRIKQLSSAIPMEYNPIVDAFIKVYTKKARKLTAKLLGRSELYFPFIEEVLDKEGLPLELKYMAVIESALNPTNVSPAGATGLWQLMYGTAKMYGLKINTYIDERRDPFKSTIAAVKYLKDLYKIYNDWLLVIAAYNCGPGNVNRAIKKANGNTNFWEIMKYLPRETRGYVPAFIAATYAMEFAREHNIYPIPVDFTYNVDTIHIVNRKISLSYLAKVTGTDEELLRKLNPELRKGIVPYTKEPYVLRVPKSTAVAIMYNKEFIFSQYAELEANKEINENYNSYVIIPPPGTKLIFHKIKKGETIKSIAEYYNIPVDSLIKWNRLQSYKPRVGAPIKIFIPVKEEPQNKYKVIYYKVQKYDTLWSLKQKFPNLYVEAVKKENNITGELEEGKWIKLILE